MPRSGKATDQSTAPSRTQRGVDETRQSLDTIDDTSLVSLTRLALGEVQVLKQEVAEIFPASNLPSFLLQGLIQLDDRTLQPEQVQADLTVLFRGIKHMGAYSVLAAPALAIHGYQRLLQLAGKDVESAFPDGYWQFYTAFGLREDEARYCVETTGFPAARRNAVHVATCWLAAALRTLFSYDDLLANEWQERRWFRSLDEVLRNQAQDSFKRRLLFAFKKSEDREQAISARTDELRAAYGLERCEADWAAQRPYGSPDDDGTPAHYTAYRRAQFQRFCETALAGVPAELRTELLHLHAVYEDSDLPAYQDQLTLLVSLHADTYRDQRVSLPLHQAAVALLVGGRYHLIDACARDAEGHLLLFANRTDPDSQGVPLPLREEADGSLFDRYGRQVHIDRSGRVSAGSDRLGRLRPPALAVLKGQVQAIMQQAEQASAPSDPAAPALDVLLAETPRANQRALRSLLSDDTQTTVDALRRAPIVLNWDAQNASQTLGLIRQAQRGCGDHVLTLLRTSRSMVFDLSHICFDGVWGTALAEVMTHSAVAFAPMVSKLRPQRQPAPAPLLLASTPAFLTAAHEARQHRPIEVAAETTTADLAALVRLRRRLHKIELSLTVNDLLLLARCVHAASYEPGAAAQAALAAVLRLDNGNALHEQMTSALEQSRLRNPALLIPMDASAIDPRMRIFPATFRNPLHTMPRNLSECARLVEQLRRRPDEARQRAFETARRELYHELYTFGLLLQTLRQVTMRGESFSIAAIRLLAHLPGSLQHLVSTIPQKIDMLNEIIKGDEVFSNVGRVAPSSSLARFYSSRDDGDTKELVWGVLSDANGQLIISLRDFRPHVAWLHAAGRSDLAQPLAQDYLDSYAATINRTARHIQRIFGYKEQET